MIQDDNKSDITTPKTKSSKDDDSLKSTSKPDSPHKDTVSDKKLDVPQIIEPGKKVVPTRKTEDMHDEAKPKHTDTINKPETKSRPSDKYPKSESDTPHLHGDDVKPNGETINGLEIPKIVEAPEDDSNDKNDLHDSDIDDEKPPEQPRRLSIRIQDRKGSIKELIPDKKHGFQLMLKVVASQCSSPVSSLLLFTQATLLPRKHYNYFTKTANYKYPRSKC